MMFYPCVAQRIRPAVAHVILTPVEDDRETAILLVLVLLGSWA